MSSVYSLTLLNCLNYRVIKERRIIGQYFMSLTLFNSTKLLELPSNGENKDQGGIFH